MKPFMPLILLMLSAPAFGEVVHLNDGTTLEGELHRTNEGWTITAADGKLTAITQSQVKSIEFKKSGGSVDSPGQRLASLRRAVANQSDISKVIERFRTFIAQNADTPAAKDAQQDLMQWQDRLDKGLVRAGDQWVSKQQLVELQAKSMQTAQAARSLIIAGKLADARPMIDKALSVTPQDPALLYLKGVIEYRQTQIVPARNDFQAVEAVVPEDGAVHNNVGVILWKQRAQMPALNEFEKAMLARSQDQTILDNVLEALHALPPEFKDKDLTKRVKQHFAEQDAALQKTMSTKGQYRWGSQWVDQREYDKLQSQQKAVQDRIDSMQKDFDGLKAALLKIDRDIANDQQVAQAMLSQSMQIDPTSGRTYSLPLPQRYYDLQRDIANLKSQRVLDQKQLEDLQKFAAQQKQLMPQEKFSGTFKAFDVDAMPGAPTALATPSTQPAPAAVSGSQIPPAPVAPTTPRVGPPATGGLDFGPATRPVVRTQ